MQTKHRPMADQRVKNAKGTVKKIKTEDNVDFGWGYLN